MSFVHTVLANCVYSTNTIMKIVSQEEIGKIGAAFEGSVGAVNEREVKGETKGIGTSKTASSMSSTSVVIEPMTY